LCRPTVPLSTTPRLHLAPPLVFGVGVAHDFGSAVVASQNHTVGGPCKDALHISKPAAAGELVAAMEGLIKGATSSQTGMTPLLVEQRQVGDEYRVAEKAINEIRNLMATRNVGPTDRAEMQADVVIRTTALMRLGQRLLELDTSVTKATR
jgi:hypothetical protein